MLVDWSVVCLFVGWLVIVCCLLLLVVVVGGGGSGGDCYCFVQFLSVCIVGVGCCCCCWIWAVFVLVGDGQRRNPTLLLLPLVSLLPLKSKVDGSQLLLMTALKSYCF